MGRSVRTLVVGLGLAAALLAGGAGSAGAQENQRLLTLRDVDAALADLASDSPFDFIASSKIGYGVTGRYDYDSFFQKSAVIYGGFFFGGRLVDQATVQLKRFARSKAAVASLESEVRELTQDADTSGWTLEQSMAVLAAARKKDELSSDELFYFAAMAGLVAATVPVVRASVEAAPELARTGQALVRSVPNDFDLFEAPQIAYSVNRSARQLAAVPGEGAALVEALIVLSRGLQAVGGEG